MDTLSGETSLSLSFLPSIQKKRPTFKGKKFSFSRIVFRLRVAPVFKAFSQDETQKKYLIF